MLCLLKLQPTVLTLPTGERSDSRQRRKSVELVDCVGDGVVFRKPQKRVPVHVDLRVALLLAALRAGSRPNTGRGGYMRISDRRSTLSYPTGSHLQCADE